jgi:hypothetical protein
MFEAFGYELVEQRDSGHAVETFVARAQGSETRALITVARKPERGHAAERLARAVTRIASAPAPCVVPSRGAGVLPGGEPYVISEVAEGESLHAHLVANGPLTADQLVLLALPLCGTLEAMRAQGLLVSQLAPEQVVLEGGVGQMNPRLVAPFLFAEEIEPGQALRHSADVRAIGLLLRAALDDVRAGRGGGLKATVSVDAGDLPLREVIDRCLTEDPAVRYASPAEVGQALAERQPSTLVSRSLPGTDAPAPTPLLTPLEGVGDILGNYVLEQLLGEGAMGRVFLARHVKLGRQAAVKVLRPEHGQNPQLVRRFFQEAQAVNQINHEHIVEIYDFAEEELPSGGRRAYFVLEPLSGQSLAERMTQGAMPISRVVRVVRQVCAALSAAHQVGVIHRDIKPDNLFLTPRGGDPDFVKVLDFGVAKLETPTGERPASGTMEGMIVGTPTYMAPEQAAGLGTDARTDVYALGTVLYELLAGHTPFSGATFGQLAAQLLTTEAPPMPRFTLGGERIPPALRMLVMRCLEKRADDRVPSMEALRLALAPFEAGAAPRMSNRRAVGLAVAVAASLLVTLGISRRTHRAVPKPPSAIAPIALAPGHGWLPAGTLVRSEPALVELSIESAPAGARVQRGDTGADLGVTPLKLKVPRQEGLMPLRLSVAGRTVERNVHTLADAAVRVDFTVQAHKGPGGSKTAVRDTRRHPAAVDPFAL